MEKRQFVSVRTHISGLTIFELDVVEILLGGLDDDGIFIGLSLAFRGLDTVSMRRLFFPFAFFLLHLLIVVHMIDL